VKVIGGNIKGRQVRGLETIWIGIGDLDWV
jgi:hypothetical protein